jgi:hypothetical protein
MRDWSLLPLAVEASSSPQGTTLMTKRDQWLLPLVVGTSLLVVADGLKCRTLSSMKVGGTPHKMMVQRCLTFFLGVSS